MTRKSRQASTGPPAGWAHLVLGHLRSPQQTSQVCGQDPDASGIRCLKEFLEFDGHGTIIWVIMSESISASISHLHLHLYLHLYVPNVPRLKVRNMSAASKELLVLKEPNPFMAHGSASRGSGSFMKLLCVYIV